MNVRAGREIEEREEKVTLSPSTSSVPRVLFFSGKGGVGKTTLAGTAALRLARGGEGDHVLVASTDPAHSLSDLFDQPIGTKGRVVDSKVEAVEIDAPSTVDNLFDGLGSLGESEGIAAAADLLKLASHSPGVDEIVSLDLLLRLIEQPSYDDVILDTAPTGHTLRLLALPELMDRYFGRLLKWKGQITTLSRRLRKIIRLPGPWGKGEILDAEEFGEELNGARGRMQRLGDLMRDPAACSLVLVTIPEAMSVLETARTFAVLTNQGMAVSAVAINMLQPDHPKCPYCTSRRLAQLAQVDRVHALMDEVPIITIEHEVEEPRGPEALRTLADKIWDGRDSILTG